ncbi:protein O-glucosyltransferase 2-like [Branchiostoma floridae]|uniref:Protein O-glucosyltransferase 2-like n=1 Tax=Branchiostoma floridae TaxID=7739 RepID=A0A9J7MNP8_BRAFL|nr:protein O-glucosyltransferase 2-like [Branchiostoma floridae]
MGFSRSEIISLVLASIVLGVLPLRDPVTGYERERVVCPGKSTVWGPGLESNFVVPARWFYIQATDTNGENFTYSPGDKAFRVSISPTGGGRARVWVQKLDRQDGTFLVRYKMFDSYDGLKIEVFSGDEPVADSPYLLPGRVYHENCYCPQQDHQKWEADMQCPSAFPQIERDLEIFPKINLNRVSKEAVDRFGTHHSLCHYTVKDNKIHRKCHGQHTGFKMFMDATLHSITRKVRIPDIEFFVNLGDWPLEKRQVKDGPLPILSWCGSEETRDIVMPTYDLTESTLETMGRVSLDMLSVQGNTGPRWVNKTEQALWRGRDSRRERLNLVDLGRKYPDLIDAALTNFFFFRDEEAKYGPKVQHISFFDFFKYKYQLNIDGTVAAYRLPYLLAGDSAVFKHESVYYEHFYSDLEPYVHYIPFRKDLTDLVPKIRWAKRNDDDARQIAENGREYARKNLLANSIFCYYERLFREYASRQVDQPQVREGMEEVPQPTETACRLCDRIDSKHDNRDEL